jgi:2-polyprenyl-6-methoxyphenol hydroxylase-like FAD-dependent oxidoreductase
MRVTDTDVIIVGAGPTGLILAAELCLAGVRPLILEQQPRPRETSKASGFNGQIVELCTTGACWTGSKRPAPVPSARLAAPRLAAWSWTSRI